MARKPRVRSNQSLKEVTISVSEVAELFEIDRDTVTRQVREQGLPKSGHGSYPAWAVIKWYVSRLKTGAKGNDSGLMGEERRKLIVAQRKHKELEAAQLRGELVPIEEVKTVIQEMGTILASQLDGLAPRMASRLSNETDPAVIQRMIFDECRGIRMASSRALEAYAGRGSSGEDPGAATEEERGGVGGRKPRAATRKPRARAVED